MNPMTAEVARRTEQDGVLFGAGLLYQWLVSVHPFADANGRTARLAVDWVLGLHGHAPVSFGDPFRSFVAIRGCSSAQTRSLRHAAQVIAHGILHTLDLLAS